MKTDSLGAIWDSERIKLTLTHKHIWLVKFMWVCIISSDSGNNTQTPVVEHNVSTLSPLPPSDSTITNALAWAIQKAKHIFLLGRCIIQRGIDFVAIAMNADRSLSQPLGFFSLSIVLFKSLKPHVCSFCCSLTCPACEARRRCICMCVCFRKRKKSPREQDQWINSLIHSHVHSDDGKQGKDDPRTSLYAHNSRINRDFNSVYVRGEMNSQITMKRNLL